MTANIFSKLQRRRRSSPSASASSWGTSCANMFCKHQTAVKVAGTVLIFLALERAVCDAWGGVFHANLNTGGSPAIHSGATYHIAYPNPGFDPPYVEDEEPVWWGPPRGHDDEFYHHYRRPPPPLAAMWEQTSHNLGWEHYQYGPGPGPFEGPPPPPPPGWPGPQYDFPYPRPYVDPLEHGGSFVTRLVPGRTPMEIVDAVVVESNTAASKVSNYNNYYSSPPPAASQSPQTSSAPASSSSSSLRSSSSCSASAFVGSAQAPKLGSQTQPDSLRKPPPFVSTGDSPPTSPADRATLSSGAASKELDKSVFASSDELDRKRRRDSMGRDSSDLSTSRRTGRGLGGLTSKLKSTLSGGGGIVKNRWKNLAGAFKGGAFGVTSQLKHLASQVESNTDRTWGYDDDEDENGLAVSNAPSEPPSLSQAYNMYDIKSTVAPSSATVLSELTRIEAAPATTTPSMGRDSSSSSRLSSSSGSARSDAAKEAVRSATSSPERTASSASTSSPAPMATSSQQPSLSRAFSMYDNKAAGFLSPSASTRTTSDSRSFSSSERPASTFNSDASTKPSYDSSSSIAATTTYSSASDQKASYNAFGSKPKAAELNNPFNPWSPQGSSTATSGASSASKPSFSTVSSSSRSPTSSETQKATYSATDGKPKAPERYNPFNPWNPQVSGSSDSDSTSSRSQISAGSSGRDSSSSTPTSQKSSFSAFSSNQQKSAETSVPSSRGNTQGSSTSTSETSFPTLESTSSRASSLPSSKPYSSGSSPSGSHSTAASTPNQKLSFSAFGGNKPKAPEASNPFSPWSPQASSSSISSTSSSTNGRDSYSSPSTSSSSSTPSYSASGSDKPKAPERYNPFNPWNPQGSSSSDSTSSSATSSRNSGTSSGRDSSSTSSSSSAKEKSSFSAFGGNKPKAPETSNPFSPWNPQASSSSSDPVTSRSGSNEASSTSRSRDTSVSDSSYGSSSSSSSSSVSGKSSFSAFNNNKPKAPEGSNPFSPWSPQSSSSADSTRRTSDASNPSSTSSYNAFGNKPMAPETSNPFSPWNPQASTTSSTGSSSGSSSTSASKKSWNSYGSKPQAPATGHALGGWNAAFSTPSTEPSVRNDDTIGSLSSVRNTPTQLGASSASPGSSSSKSYSVFGSKPRAPAASHSLGGWVDQTSSSRSSSTSSDGESSSASSGGTGSDAPNMPSAVGSLSSEVGRARVLSNGEDVAPERSPALVVGASASSGVGGAASTFLPSDSLPPKTFSFAEGIPRGTNQHPPSGFDPEMESASFDRLERAMDPFDSGIRGDMRYPEREGEPPSLAKTFVNFDNKPRDMNSRHLLDGEPPSLAKSFAYDSRPRPTDSNYYDGGMRHVPSPARGYDGMRHMPSQARGYDYDSRHFLPPEPTRSSFESRQMFPDVSYSMGGNSNNVPSWVQGGVKSPTFYTSTPTPTTAYQEEGYTAASPSTLPDLPGSSFRSKPPMRSDFPRYEQASTFVSSPPMRDGFPPFEQAPPPSLSIEVSSNDNVPAWVKGGVREPSFFTSTPSQIAASSGSTSSSSSFSSPWPAPSPQRTVAPAINYGSSPAPSYSPSSSFGGLGGNPSSGGQPFPYDNWAVEGSNAPTWVTNGVSKPNFYSPAPSMQNNKGAMNNIAEIPSPLRSIRGRPPEAARQFTGSWEAVVSTNTPTWVTDGVSKENFYSPAPSNSGRRGTNSRVMGSGMDPLHQDFEASGDVLLTGPYSISSLAPYPAGTSPHVPYPSPSAPDQRFDRDSAYPTMSNNYGSLAPFSVAPRSNPPQSFRDRNAYIAGQRDVGRIESRTGIRPIDESGRPFDPLFHSSDHEDYMRHLEANGADSTGGWSAFGSSPTPPSRESLDGAYPTNTNSYGGTIAPYSATSRHDRQSAPQYSLFGDTPRPQDASLLSTSHRFDNSLHDRRPPRSDGGVDCYDNRGRADSFDGRVLSPSSSRNDYQPMHVDADLDFLRGDSNDSRRQSTGSQYTSFGENPRTPWNHALGEWSVGTAPLPPPSLSSPSLPTSEGSRGYGGGSHGAGLNSRDEINSSSGSSESRNDPQGRRSAGTDRQSSKLSSRISESPGQSSSSPSNSDLGGSYSSSPDRTSSSKSRSGSDDRTSSSAGAASSGSVAGTGIPASSSSSPGRPKSYSAFGSKPKSPSGTGKNAAFGGSGGYLSGF